ncbi:MGDG synthase family glycosyltransferase [Clostridium sp. Marseille-P299]|uniref:MGDG synthase family glycosyltransferase n=1 Tax=Clostridium sp. Marseille-P299 TaxID=1805477 RepID=UPI00082E5FE8|nr:glycosyltransferase [Clostridium sp. Marseille-P299]
MRVLILSCKTGGGHDAAGIAIKERFEKEGHEAVMFDYLTLAGGRVSKWVEKLYVDVVKYMPKLFGKVYQLGMFVSKRVKRSPVYYVNAKMGKYLKEYLNENHFDAIVMPHLYPAETITYMKNKGISLPLTIGVATDYTCIPFWEETNCDYYIIPHKDLLDEFSSRGIPKEKLIPIGIPVSLKFLEYLELESDKRCSKNAREELGLPSDKKIHLLIGGSMGAGNIIKLTSTVWSMNQHKICVVVICGNNKKVFYKLKKQYKNIPNVIIVGHTKKMHLYMQACDIVYTKPGGLTSTEVAVLGKPLIHTSPIPGCETANREFFRKHKMSVSSKTIKGQVLKGIKLLNSPEMIERMKKSQGQNVSGDASTCIMKFIEDKVNVK